jgi:F-type H+-transporting ATPase subunit gamma
MEMIATSKMRRAQEMGIAGRPYSEKITQVLADLAAIPQVGVDVPPLLQRRELKKICVVHITSDRGLCGGLNANVNRLTSSFILKQKVPVSLITVGRRGQSFMNRYGREIRANFSALGDRPTLLDTLPISHIVIEDYTHKLVDMVYIAYPRFITTMTQHPVLEQLLPVQPAERKPGEGGDYIYEPNAETVLDLLLPRFVEMQIYHAILESIASEQSARMVAMRNATENAKELIEDLTLAYNKARQEMITKELADITGGAVSLV